MRPLLRLLPALALVGTLVGCGGDKRATVTGKVTVGGKGPLTGGNIRFVSVADPNKVGGGQIKPDGTYEVNDAPVGDCKVVIDNTHLDPEANKKGGMGPGPGAMGPPMKGMGPGGPGGPPGGAAGPKDADKAKMSGGPTKGADVPAEMGAKSEMSGQKYTKIDGSLSKADTTTLTFTVEKGSNTKDFDVK